MEGASKNTYQLLGPFTQLLPMSHLKLKGSLRDADLTVIENGGILIENEEIIAVGDYEDLIFKADQYKPVIQPIAGDSVCLPGFIDCHTHSCFAGSRARDYALRNSGSSYLEIAAAGGGIWDTVTQTRKANFQELEAGLIARCQRFLRDGVTTLEVKSGYGLSVAEELKMLRVIRSANEKVPQDLIATCLAAHMLPRDFDGSASAYLDTLQTELLPILLAEGLTHRIDAFIEKSAFSPEQIVPYLQKAKSLGFDLTLHADQFTAMGSAVAVALEAKSADHLEVSGTKEIEALAKSNTVATALPGASLGLGCGFTPARKLLDAGACLAIASDYNPGSAPMGDLLTQAAILGAFEKLSHAEVFAGITTRAAAALGLQDRGSLEPGKKADLVLFPTDNFTEILYNQGQLKPVSVWKSGQSVFDNKQ